MPLGFIIQRRTPMIFSGRLRHRIDLLTLTEAQDSTGGTSLSNNIVYATVWASIEAVTGKENAAAGSYLSEVTHQIVIRYIGAAPGWLKSRTYVGNALIKDPNGNLQQAQGSGGLSGTSKPIWSAIFNATTTDNGITWKNIGPAPARTGVNASMQVRFESRIFQILDVLNADERKKSLVLPCVEINDSNQQSALIPGTPAGNFLNSVDIDGGNF